MNHSCDPTSYSAGEYDTATGGNYFTVATRNIRAGEQISCDYDLFEWDAKDKGIDQCGCAASICRGPVHGFGALCREVQEARLGVAYATNVIAWTRANPGTVYFRVSPPPGIRVASCGIGGGLGWSLVASRRFTVGELVFVNRTFNVEESKVARILLSVPDPSWVLPDNESTTDAACFWTQPQHVTRVLNWVDHSVKLAAGKRALYGFDTFMDHSCMPNTRQVPVHLWVVGGLYCSIYKFVHLLCQIR
jgi:hypothetical protein